MVIELDFIDYLYRKAFIIKKYIAVTISKKD